MSRMIALEWNAHEIRAAVAALGGRRVVIEHAFAVPCNGGEPDAEQQEQRIGRLIADELDARGIGRLPALVVVRRAAIELRQLQLPPAPDEDLPDMVRFQASREFNELTNDWRLDFVTIDETADGARTILAMAIAPSVVRRIEAICEEAELKMQRLLLRPCASAPLLAPDKPEMREQLRLLVELLGCEADLTVVLGGKAVFLRSMWLDDENPSLSALQAEVRLTMAAVQNQFLGRKFESIVICGDAPGWPELARHIHDELGIDSEVVDPFDGLELGPSVRDAPPAHPGRFAPLLSALVEESHRGGHAVDFLHPRRRVEAPSRRKRWVAVATAVAVLMLAWLVYARVQNYRLADEVARLSCQSNSLDTSLAGLKSTRDTVAEIERWREGEAVLLDQLYSLSDGFPLAQDAILGQLTFAVRQGRSQVDMKGWVRNADVIAKMEEKIRARAGQITSRSSREDDSRKDYSWWFEASLLEAEGAKP